jgi:hypothetical protein
MLRKRRRLQSKEASQAALAARLRRGSAGSTISTASGAGISEGMVVASAEISDALNSSAAASASGPARLPIARTDANSRVPFSLLTSQEKLQRSRNQSVQSKALKRSNNALRDKLNRSNPAILRANARRALSEEEVKLFTPKFRRDLLAASRRLKSERFELPDHAHLLENLAAVIADKSFDVHSLAFDVMATQIRPFTLRPGNMTGMR